MKANNDKRKWYILIAVALLIGIIIGYFATINLTITGNANNISNKSIEQDLLISGAACGRGSSGRPGHFHLDGKCYIVLRSGEHWEITDVD